jgi:hypothetical protein
MGERKAWWWIVHTCILLWWRILYDAGDARSNQAKDMGSIACFLGLTVNAGIEQLK